jgi:histidine ammonia-lyase
MRKTIEPLVVREPDDLTISAFEEVVVEGRAITLDSLLLADLARVRQAVVALLGRGGAVYGVNTGMGFLAGVTLTADEERSHQRNLLLGRAVGGPPYLRPVEARALLLARLNGFLRGHAGVTPQLCSFIADRLNDGFLPAIPRQGIGSAGEIIPLAHAFQTLTGVGFVLAPDGTVQDAAMALADRQVAPFELAAKEGIALLAGAPGALGLAIVHHRTARHLARQLLLAAACAIEAIRAPLTPYHPRVARLANDAEMGRVLERLGGFLAGAGGERRGLQAPVSFRVIPQVHAQLERTLDRFEGDLNRALSASDDSSAFIDGDFLSTGNFHAIGLTAAMDATALALVQAAELAAQHLHRLLDGRFSGLPDQLTPRPGPRAGLVVVHKRVVGLVHQLRRLATPASIGIVDTSLGQEDAMTFAFEAAEDLRQVEALVAEVVGCELLAARQAWGLRGQPIAAGLEPAAALIENTVPLIETDRPFGSDIGRLVALLEAGAFDGNDQDESAGRRRAR